MTYTAKAAVCFEIRTSEPSQIRTRHIYDPQEHMPALNV
jgi:hypothetical protein